MNKSIIKNVVFPISDVITGWDISKSLTYLRDSWVWDRARLYEYQCERLQSLIKIAYNNIPYYRTLFDENEIKPSQIQTPADLKLIPLLTKEILRDNFENQCLLSTTLDKSKLIYLQSSGSTGFRTPFYINKEAYGFNIACNLRGWEQMGYSMGDKLIKVSQNKRYSFMKKFQDQMTNTLLFSLPYKEETLKEFYKMFCSFAPEFLRSYPDPLLFIVQGAKKFNFQMPGLRGINTTGNILFDEIRKISEEFFNCPVFDSYGCEGGAVAFECKTHEHYHLAEENGIVEIIDENGNEVKEGEKGRVIVTDLHNFATPFIRYDSKDFAIKGGGCSLGVQHKTVKKIIGRDNDILVTPSGQFLIAQTFTTYFKYFKEIRQFQVYQETQHKIVFRLVLSEELTSERKNEIFSYWSTYTSNKMDFEIEELTSIEPLISGKIRFLVRNPEVNLEL